MTTIQPRTSVVTIYQGDYLDRIRHIEAKYEAALQAEGRSTPLLNEERESDRLRIEHETVKSKAEESAIDVTLRALGRKEWRALVAAHPPREDNTDDKAVGVNEESFKDPLILASIIEPELSEDDLDQLSEGDNDRLYLTAWALNRAPATSPKALRSPVSRENTKSDAN